MATEGILAVVIPQLGVNDAVATIVEWYIPDEGVVPLGQPLCALETTKAVFELEAEVSGYVLHLAVAGSDVSTSQPIALIGLDLEALRVERSRYGQTTRRLGAHEVAPGLSRATTKAEELAAHLGVDLARVSAEGIVREQDVLRYYEASSAGERAPALELFWEHDRQPVIIYGAGRGAVTLKECLDFHQSYQVVCFVDDNPQHPVTLCELPVYGSFRLQEIVEQGVRSLACEIADGRVRLRVFRQCSELGIDFLNVIHPWAYVAPTVKMGKGNYVKAGAIIETDTVIGNCCIIDNGATIPHDNSLGDGCHIAPGAALGSGISIGALAIIGTGASLATGIRIGRSVIISVGSSVVRDVLDYAVVEGVPAKVVGKRKDND